MRRYVARMASIRTRRRSDGTAAYQVMWREGGKRGAKQESETFNDDKAAADFRSLVEGYGEHWPPGWVKGLGVVEQTHERRPFEAWAAEVIDSRTGIDATTRHRYQRIVEGYMVPWFGRLDVASDTEITDDTVARWINALANGERDPHDDEKWLRKPYSPKSIANAHGLLFTIMQRACDARPPLRTYNPCSSTRLPRQDDHTAEEAAFLTHDEYALIAAHLCPEARDLADVAVGTGMRWGEVSALQTRDFLDLDGKRPRVRVERSWKLSEHDRPFIGPPKSKRSRRTIPLSAHLVAVAGRLTADRAPNEFVLRNPRTGEPWTRHAYYKAHWLPAVTAARAEGLVPRPRVHDLRHTYVSWLIAAGVPLPRIQRLAGHESITTTIDRYGHLIIDEDDDVPAAIEQALTQRPPLRAVS
jgi:integrase